MTTLGERLRARGVTCEPPSEEELTRRGDAARPPHVVVDAAPDDAPPVRRRRKPTLAGALKQARRIGVAVSGATINNDGSVSLTFGEGNHHSEVNEWNEVYAAKKTEIH